MDTFELKKGHKPRWILKNVQCAACKKEAVLDWALKTVQDPEGNVVHYHDQCYTGPKVLS